MNFPRSFLNEVKKCKKIWIHGMGGGYDVFSGIPLAYELSQFHGVEVCLGNLSFAHDLGKKGKKNRMIVPKGKNPKDYDELCYEVHFTDYLKEGEKKRFREELGYPKNYFPEFHLSSWYYNRFNKLDQPVYSFNLRTQHGKPYLSVKKYTEIMQTIIETEKIDGLILVDAGVDSCLKGDEQGVGTFGEDFLSIFAAKNIRGLKTKLLYCIGNGTEGGISERDFFENMTELKRMGGLHGSFSLEPETEAAKMYRDSVMSCCPVNTTINQCILASIEGNYGLYSNEHLAKRGCGAVFIHPLMSIVYLFDLNVVIKAKLFGEELEQATSLANLQSKFEVQRFHMGLFGGQSGTQFKGKRRFKSLF